MGLGLVLGMWNRTLDVKVHLLFSYVLMAGVNQILQGLSYYCICGCLILSPQ